MEGITADLFADEPDFELPQWPTVLEGRDEPVAGRGEKRENPPKGVA